MIATSTQSLSSASSSNPLHHDGILELVLNNLLGQGLYVTTVNKSWRACFNKLAPKGQQLTFPHAHSSDCTSYAAVFASPATLLWAHAVWHLQFYTEALDLGAYVTGENIQSCAGRYADIATLQTAHQRGLVWTSLIARIAALSGDAAKLAWLCHEQHCPLPDGIVAAAAEGGSVEMLQWLKQKGFAFSKHAFFWAAGRPHNIPVLQFLLNEGCEWGELTCHAAAGSGDVDMLRFLRDSGCPWLAAKILSAAVEARANNAAMLQYLWDQGVQADAAQLTELLDFAGVSGMLESAQWLRQQGALWPEVLQASPNGIWHNAMIAWARAEGCTAPCRWIVHSDDAVSGADTDVDADDAEN
jgi:hypothetical protein